MKILHVVDSLKIGGSESLVATLVAAFSKKGVENVVCGLGTDGPLRDRLDQAGCPSYHLDKAFGVRPDVMARLGWLMLRERCDVVVTHHYRQLFHVLPAAKLLGKRVVHVEHDSHSYAAQPGLVERLAKMAPFVHRFCFVSNEINEWFSQNMPAFVDKFVVIQNGIDTERFAPSESSRLQFRNDFGIAENAIVIGTCARLEPVKDLPLLIKSFSMFRAAMESGGPACHLVIAGDGSLRDELRVLTQDLGVAEHCHFTGVISNIPELLSSFDLYSITSSNEGLPLSVLEAMSAELPIVSVNVGALDEVIDDSVGVLLKGRSHEECAAAMERLGNDNSLRKKMGRAARELIVQRFSLDSMVKEYMDAIN